MKGQEYKLHSADINCSVAKVQSVYIDKNNFSFFDLSLFMLQTWDVYTITEMKERYTNA